MSTAELAGHTIIFIVFVVLLRAVSLANPSGEVAFLYFGGSV
jgi:hypothetical protein